MITAGIVTIGDEILIGQIVDTNSAWLGDKLNKLGIKVSRILSIGDGRDEIISTLDHAIDNYNITFVTGGLGPTKDDITKFALAEIFSSELVMNQECFEHVRKLCELKSLDFNELNQNQSLVPACAETLVNEYGTAPCMIFSRGKNILISLPGVPFEMKSLCENKIFPIIKERFELTENIHISKAVFGIPESVLAMRIASWEDSLPDYLHLAYLPNPKRILLRLSAYGESSREEIEAQFLKLKEIIPQNYIGDSEISVEKSVADMLMERGETLSTAESCTGGAIAARFTAMSGASSYFMGGVISYDNRIKTEVLGVDAKVIEEKGAVSEEVVIMMAEGVRKLMGTTYAISTSGVAGPTGGTEEKPVGTVWMAVATPTKTITFKKVFTLLREQNIEYASSFAISLLRDYLINLP